MVAEQSNLVPLFRKVIRGAAVASLDIAGSALLPGGWPILKAALGPVLDLLSERFMGRDVTSSPELAEQAAAEFARDARLQELFRTNLLDALDPVVKSGARVEEDGVPGLNPSYLKQLGERLRHWEGQC